MKVVSLFSGAGGLDLGFELAGHQVIWANDFDQQAVETYNHNIGKNTGIEAVNEDILKLLSGSKTNIDKLVPEADIIIAGFPCQGFSIANIDRNMNDERNFLYLELLKLISIKKPKYFLLENVKGLENMEKGEVLNLILDDLEKAGTKESKLFKDDGVGYDVYYNVLNALDYGVPQNRERVIIFGKRKDIISKNIDKYIITHKEGRKILNIPATHSKDSINKQKQKPYEIINKLYKDWKNKKTLKNTNNSIIYSWNTIRDAIDDLPLEHCEEIFNHKGSQCKVKISNRVGNRETFWNKYSPTIMGRGSGTGGPLIPPHPNKHRRFTVREVARFQTFPDEFEFKGSDSACYRQIGNAVPVLMAFNIAKIFNEI